MAKVIQNDQNVIIKPWWGRLNIVYIGLGMGLGWWAVASILRKYVVEPIACRDLATASACVDSFSVAGSIAAVLIAVLGAYVLVRAIQPRPIVISVAAAALLWDLGAILHGLSWYEALGWSLLLYLGAYALFALIARIPTLIGSLLTGLAAVAVIRLLLAL